jgi:sensor histidine kinase YesM
MMIYITGIVFVTGLTVYGWTRTSEIQNSLALGSALQVKSREVQSLMKDIVFDLFAPKIYGQLRSLTYSPRSAVTLRQWQNAVFEYKRVFRDFMEMSFFLRSNDEFIQDQYLTALTMNDQAMTMLTSMEETLVIMRDEYRFAENPYNEMQKNEALAPFFKEFQETSYYFSNSFEGFMNYFIKTLEEEAVKFRTRMYALFIIIDLSIIAVYLLLSLLLSRDVNLKLQKVEQAFRAITHGDFSARMEIISRDEFGDMSRRFNILVDDLKTNVNSILNLTRDVGSSLTHTSNLEDLLTIFTQAIVQDTTADTALIIRNTDNVIGELSAQAGIALKPEELETLLKFLSRRIIRPGNHLLLRDTGTEEQLPDAVSSLLAAPLTLEDSIFGIIVSLKLGQTEGFSDLGATRFMTFAEFASLTMDNHVKYRALIENQEAKFQALQSQVKPHFLYNILSGIIGLNRIGDSKKLEKSVLALKEMLRYIQSNSRWASLEAEFDCIDKYCSLQQIRFGSRLKYSLELDPEARYLQIPRLLLQPLVENAVLHGIEPLERPGNLTVRAQARRHGGEDGALIEIIDNGAGFDTSLLERESNIGIQNVMGRLRMTWPHSLFEIVSKPGKGTRVVIEV